MTQRKGASKRSDIPPEVLAALNAGTLETATLAEGLAIDFRHLLSRVAPELSAADLDAVRAEDGVTTRMKSAGGLLQSQLGVASFDRFAGHPSDTVRGWAAYMIGTAPKLTLKQRLSKIRTLADDQHFGVREWAWLALRDRIAAEIDEAIQLLTPWTDHDSANLRRFASESTRPRGVWCAHITLLKTAPELGMVILEPLRSDSSKYVRDSVANWLNDAGKTQPEWVRQLCRRWSKESPTAETGMIIKRATRNL